MAQGLEVLQAAIAGKRVRLRYIHYNSTIPYQHMWLHWCPDCRTLEVEGPGHSSPYQVSVHQLWHDDWEIEDLVAERPTVEEAAKYVHEKFLGLIDGGFLARLSLSEHRRLMVLLAEWRPAMFRWEISFPLRKEEG